jgi:TRAP-type C4-dicarboxylate transport system permease small subunit
MTAPAHRARRLQTLLDVLCGLLAAAALFAIMVITLVDVAGRKLADASLPGSLELTELLMVTVIFAALPMVSLHGEHVVFDSLDAWLGPRWRRAQRFVVEAFCALALAGMAGLLWHKAGQMMEFGDRTAQLGIPQGPFVYGMSLLCSLTAAVHLALALRPAGTRAAAAGGER